MLGLGSTLDFNFFIGFLYKHLLKKHGEGATRDRFLKALAWSFEHLQQGVWPSRGPWGEPLPPQEAGWAGRPLANGYCGVLWVLRADLDFLPGVGLQRATSNAPCALCKANASDLPWTDCTSFAAWLPTTWTATSWKEAHGDPTCALVNVPGVTACSYVPDLMHIKHLGTDCYFFASLIQYMLGKSQGTAEEKLARFWETLRAAYKQLRTTMQLNRLSYSMFEAGENPFPKLKVKAAECRALGPALFEVAKKKLTDRVQVEGWMLQALACSVEVELLLDTHKEATLLPTDVARRFQKACSVFNVLVTKLGRHFHDKGENLFHYKIKNHYLSHAALSTQDCCIVLRDGHSVDASCASGLVLATAAASASADAIASTCATSSSPCTASAIGRESPQVWLLRSCRWEW